jgi:hypothetical protein
MAPMKAHVRNGQIVVDEPTDLPEGEVLYLERVDPGDELDDEEREELHAELRASIAEAKAGKLVDAEEILAEIRARRT